MEDQKVRTLGKKKGGGNGRVKDFEVASMVIKRRNRPENIIKQRIVRRRNREGGGGAATAGIDSGSSHVVSKKGGLTRSIHPSSLRQ